MKFISSLTKAEKHEYLYGQQHGKRDRNYNKNLAANAFVDFLFENNEVAEIAEWFKHKAHTSGGLDDNFISVYASNRISERLKKAGALPLTTGDKIKKARSEAGMTQQTVAQKTGFLAQHISRWEKGERIPKLTTLKKLAEAIGCDITDLI